MRVGRCGELKVCWGPTTQHIFLHLPHYPPHMPPHFPTHPIHFPTLLHSPHIFPYLPPHPNIFPYISPHTPHISSHSSPDLPLHTSLFTPCTLPHLSPHILPHSFAYVAKLPSNSKSPIKFFTATKNLKSCFGVGNVNFRCMKVWRSYHVTKLLATIHKCFGAEKRLPVTSPHVTSPQ